MKKRILKKSMAAILAASLALSAFGAAGALAAEEEEGDYVMHDSLVVALADPEFIHPNSQNNDSLLMSVYEMLFESPTFGGEMEPVLADASRGEYGGYDHEEGTSVYTVYIYDYIYDSAGHHITADDVAFSYNTKVETGNANTMQGIWGTVEAIDDTTIEFDLAYEPKYIGELSYVLANAWIYSEEAWNESSDHLASEACGTGRYQMDEYVGGSHMTVSLRDDYWQTDESLIGPNQQAYYQTIRQDFISEDTVKETSLKNGDLDIATVSSNSLDDFLGNDDFNSYSYAENRLYFLCANCSEESIMSDVNMRLAVFNAVNLDALEILMGGPNAFRRAYSNISDVYPDYDPEWETWDNYNAHTGDTDYDLVQSYLDAAGYNGETIELLGGTNVESVMTIILGQLQEAGINAHLTCLEGSAIDPVYADPTAWDATVFWNGSSDYGPNIFNNEKWDTNKTSTGMTQTFIEDEELQNLIETARSASEFSSENTDALLNYIYDNAYSMGLGSQVDNYIFTDHIPYLVLNARNFVVFAACPWEDDVE